MLARNSSCPWGWIALAMAALSGGCNRMGSSAPAAAPPAKVAHIAKEDELNTIQLSPDAERRLGIELVAVQFRRLQRVKTYGGEVTLPTGASIIVSAPVGGTLQTP